jgi:hypothetical protein
VRFEHWMRGQRVFARCNHEFRNAIGLDARRRDRDGNVGPLAGAGRVSLCRFRRSFVHGEPDLHRAGFQSHD